MEMTKKELLVRLKEIQTEELELAEEMSLEELDSYIDRYLNFVEW